MIARLLLIVVASAAFAHAQPAATRQVPQILWQERHAMRGMHGRMTLLHLGDDGYRVVGSSGFRNPDKSFTEQWWMLALDRQGKRRDLKEHVAEGNQADIHAALLLPQGRTLLIGGMLDWIAQVDADGTMRPSDRIRAGDFDTSVQTAVADRPDSLLVAGSRTISYAEKPSLADAWLARIRHDGSIVWQTRFDRAHQDGVAAILPLKDGGCVLAINSGKYNKFGAGPSALWLVRCDADGNEVADAVIEGAQIYAGGQKYLVPLGEAGRFGVSYTVGQLSGPMKFDAHVAAFDAMLKPLWSRQLPQPSIHSLLIVNHGPEIVAVSGATGRSPLLARLDPANGEVRSQFSLPFEGNFEANDVLAEPDGVVVVGSFQDRGRPRDRDREEDAVILKVR